MKGHSEAPWEPWQVDKLNFFQNSQMCHPFTCGNDRMDEAHKKYQSEHGGDFGQLVATENGWICPVCDYTQDWAHEFQMKEYKPYNPWHQNLPKNNALIDVCVERANQDAKWGVSNQDMFTWITVLMEEVGEMAKCAMHLKFGGEEAKNLREEAVQVAAVGLAIVECIDRNGHVD